MYCYVSKQRVMYLLGCVSLHCFTVVNGPKVLLPCLDLLMTIPVLLNHGTINVFEFLDMVFTNLG